MKAKTALLLFALIVLFSIPAFAANKIGIVAGQSRVLPVYDLERVAVADPSIADVVVISNREVVINGVQPGTTTLHLWEKAGRSEYEITVYVDSSAVEKQIAGLIGDSGLSIKVIGDTVIIDGVASEETHTRAVRVAGAFGKVVDLVRVPPAESGAAEPAPDVASLVAQSIGDDAVSVRMYNNTLFLEGTVLSEMAKRRAEEIAGSFVDKYVSLLLVAPKVEPQPLPPPVQEAPPVDPGPPLDRQIAAAIEYPSISVRVINETIILEGTVPQQFQSKRAEGIARAFGLEVLNLLQVVPEQPPGRPEEKIPITTPTLSLTEAMKIPKGPQEPAQEESAQDEPVQKHSMEAAGKRVIETAGEPVTGAGERGTGAVGERAKESDSPKPAEPDIAEIIAGAINRPQIEVKRLGEVVFLEGEVTDEWERTRVEKIARALSPTAVTLVRVVTPSPPEKERTALPEKERTATSPEREVALPPATTVPPEIPGEVAGQAGEGQVESEEESMPPLKVGLAKEELAVPRTVLPVPRTGWPEEAAEPGGATPEPEGAKPEPEKPKPETPEERRARIADQVREALADPRISVRVVGERLFLEGQLANSFEVERAKAIAQALYPDTFSLLQVVDPVAEPISSKVARALGRQGVEVREAGNKLVLTGEVQNQDELQEVLDIAGAFGVELINHLVVKEPLQVILQVQALEILRNEVENLGFTWGRSERGIFKANEWFFTQLDLNSPLERVSLLATRLEVLVNSGAAKLLANPSLITVDGRTANFLAGGEIPIVLPGDDNKREVLWKEYGVKLSITPKVERNGDISVEIAPEVSSLDWSNGIRVDGLLLPAMKTRRAQSTVRVANGATIMLAGLLQSEDSKQVEKVPLLGDLPILGRLFRSERFQKQETELVFLVTPQIADGTGTLTGELEDLRGRFESE